MDFTKLIDNVPDYQEFLTVDEMDENSKKLAAEYPEIVSIFEAGKSRKGHPIYCLKIGNGPKNGFMFGCPHPNEPMGAMMLEYFSRALAEDAELREGLGYTWYLIKSIDVDGTQLNEGWFKGPFTLYHYTRNYFRPAGYEQAEWTFPIDYKNYKFDKPIPETQALMKIIDEVKPAFMYSLHNAGFGGTYWYTTNDAPEIFPLFHEASKKQNVPLHLGEPEVSWTPVFYPAVFKMFGTKENYDHLEKYSAVPPETLLTAGTSSDAYAGQYGCTTLVTELPYFYDPRIESSKPMEFTREEAALQKMETLKKQYAEIGEHFAKVDAFMSDDNPFVKMIRLMLKDRDKHFESEVKFIKENDEYKQPCKESEAFDNLELPKFYRLFSWGLLIRGIEHEIAKNPPKEVLDKLIPVHMECEVLMKKYGEIAENDLQYDVIPIQKLVRIQLECGMLLAEHVSKQ